MHFYDELYFEITAKGSRDELDKLANFLNSGELDDFFEVSKDYINYDDAYTNGENTCELIFTNDELGIEIDEIDLDDFLETFCKAARALYVRGTIYDIDDNEFSFSSPEHDSSYYDDSVRHIEFNDELDEAARDEELNEDDED